MEFSPPHTHIIIIGSGYLHPLTYISYKVDCPNRLSWKMINLGVKAFTSGNQVIDLDNFPSTSHPGSELWHLKNHFPRHQFLYRCGGNDCRNMFLRWEGSLAGVRVFESWWIRNQFPTHQSRNWKKTMRMKTKSTNESIRRLNARVRSRDGCSVPSWICVNCIYIVFPTRWIWPLASLSLKRLCFIRKDFTHSCHAYFEQLFLNCNKDCVD